MAYSSLINLETNKLVKKNSSELESKPNFL